MKKSIFGKVGAAAVVLTLVTASLVGGTFAKYTSEVNGKAEVTVAKWEIDLTDGTDSLTTKPISLINENTDAATADGKVAPGSNGTFKVYIDGTNTEVAYEYNLKIDTTGVDAPIKFYKGTKEGGEIPAGGIEAKVAADAAAADKKAEVSIYWEWNPDSADAADTTLGKDATGVAKEIKLTLTANQTVAPVTP